MDKVRAAIMFGGLIQYGEPEKYLTEKKETAL